MNIRNLETGATYEVDDAYRTHKLEVIVLPDGTELDWKQAREVGQVLGEKLPLEEAVMAAGLTPDDLAEAALETEPTELEQIVEEAGLTPNYDAEPEGEEA